MGLISPEFCDNFQDRERFSYREEVAPKMSFQMTHHFANRNHGLLLAVTVLGLIPAASFAGIPGSRSLPKEGTAGSDLSSQSNCLGGDSNPDLLSPCSIPYGETYSQWAKDWEIWFLKLTAPIDGVGGDPDCSINQQGPVWFLTGLFPPGPTTAYCTVPVGKALFFPIINTECSNLESPPFFGANAADRRSCAEHFMDGSTDLAAAIDGRPIHGAERYNFTSPDMPFTTTPQNMFGIPCPLSGPCTGFSTNNGYYLMLAPLSPGLHTLTFTGTFPHRNGGFTLNTTYHLTVQ
jgi:hypothetical protein